LERRRLVHLVSMFDPAVALIIPELGKYKTATNEKARTVLGWEPRSSEDAIVATAESLLRLGLLKGSKKTSSISRRFVVRFPSSPVPVC